MITSDENKTKNNYLPANPPSNLCCLLITHLKSEFKLHLCIELSRTRAETAQKVYPP